MTEWFETKQGLWGQMWSSLHQGVSDASHPARLPTLATLSPTGWPEARSVVLRGADQGRAQLVLHTDLFSHKVASLRATPRAALHIWDAASQLQIRLQADVDVDSGPHLRVLWDKIPDHAQQSYGVTPPPGTEIEAALDYVKEPDPNTFAVLRCDLVAVDLVYLGAAHRRARYARQDDWAGQWLSP